YPSAARIALTEDSASASAVADRDDELRIRCRLVRAAQRHLHVLRDRAGNEQHVRMARARDEADAKALEVVERIVERMNLELTAIAGARVHLADAESPAQHGEEARL